MKPAIFGEKKERLARGSVKTQIQQVECSLLGVQSLSKHRAALQSYAQVSETAPLLKCLPIFQYCTLPKHSRSASRPMQRCGDNVMIPHNASDRRAVLRLKRWIAKLHILWLTSDFLSQGMCTLCTHNITDSLCDNSNFFRAMGLLSLEEVIKRGQQI